jgi:hypothetical protein
VAGFVSVDNRLAGTHRPPCTLRAEGNEGQVNFVHKMENAVKALPRNFVSGAVIVLLAAAGSVSTLGILGLGATAFAQGAQHTPHKARPHHHKRGRDLLGDKIHQDGKHDIDKTASGKTVSAEVKGGKVVGMTAADQPMSKVRSHRKLASVASGFILAGFTPDTQLAQDDGDYYYGYCIDDGVETDCYWYDADEVDASGDWDDFDTWDSGY